MQLERRSPANAQREAAAAARRAASMQPMAAGAELFSADPDVVYLHARCRKLERCRYSPRRCTFWVQACSPDAARAPLFAADAKLFSPCTDSTRSSHAPVHRSAVARPGTSPGHCQSHHAALLAWKQQTRQCAGLAGFDGGRARPRGVSGISLRPRRIPAQRPRRACAGSAPTVPCAGRPSPGFCRRS